MKNGFCRYLVLIPAFLLLGVSAWALDFASMSNEELADLQGAITNAPDGEQDAYRLEWEERFANMSEEEKKQYSRADENDDNQLLKQPKVLGRGYDSQGTGTVIYGGSSSPQPAMGGNR